MLVAASKALAELIGANNETIQRLFQTQCAKKIANSSSTSGGTTTTTTTDWAAKIDDALSKFNALEESLCLKRRELSSSDGLSGFPVSNDVAGQREMAVKIVDRLRAQIQVLEKTELSLPEVREKAWGCFWMRLRIAMRGSVRLSRLLVNHY